MTRTELFYCHCVYDVMEFGARGEHYYVYTLPYYGTVYSGRHVYPDGVRFYMITPERYVELVTLKNKDRKSCQSYVEESIDPFLLSDGTVDGFVYIGNGTEYVGSIPSMVMQAIYRNHSELVSSYCG